jgi:hypothetical protein
VLLADQADDSLMMHAIVAQIAWSDKSTATRSFS